MAMASAVFTVSSLSCCLSHRRQHEGAKASNIVVHVGSMPLRAPPGPAQWVLSSADRLLYPGPLQHFYTILQPTPGEAPCSVFDFQPENPEDLYTVLIALSGGVVPGVVLERSILQLPTRRCWMVGVTKGGIGMEDAADFNRRWDTRLQLCKHDCRHHTNAFVEFLTGEKEILHKLKNIASS